MGFWSRLFGSPAKIIDHPDLGRVTWEPRSGWHVDEVTPIGCRGKPSLSVAGYENGPMPECVATYQRPRRDWSSIGTKVAADIFELNQNYFSDEPAHGMKSAAEVSDSCELLAIVISAEGQFSLTFGFDWQDPNDGHEVTMFFENWVPAGNSIDG
jgi:hypothetical protein